MVVDKLPYSDNQKKEMLSMPLLNHNKESIESLSKENKVNLWTINSAATQYLHNIKSEERKLEIETKIPKIINRFNRG